MLAKALATGFNSPFVSIPGSGFAQAFIGIDAVIVRFLARKAKKLARKWGGQCIVFIDEIDAVGMRRQALRGGNMQPTPKDPGLEFFGPFGALNPSGDLINESEAWREHVLAMRAPEPRNPYPTWMQKVGNIVNQGIFPGMMGGQGQLALNQLLVTMDGIDNPPFMRRFLTNRVNSLLDAVYIVPRRIGRVSLRLPPPRPLGAQIYFIGATNVPFERLDPALTRPGRMGRHVWFRTPTKDDRKDIFDLYLGKVAHDADLVHGLGAMAAEHVFYGENTEGVGGDLQNATSKAAVMVGAAGMAPAPLDLAPVKLDDESEEQARERIAKRFEQIGLRLMNRT